MKLSKPFRAATQDLHAIPYATCQKAIPRHWQKLSGDEVKAQSILWLFCWAKTGMGSPKAEGKAREVFDALSPEGKDFNHFDKHVGHDYAERFRYTSKDIESQVKALL